MLIINTAVANKERHHNHDNSNNNKNNNYNINNNNNNNINNINMPDGKQNRKLIVCRSRISFGLGGFKSTNKAFTMLLRQAQHNISNDDGDDNNNCSVVNGNDNNNCSVVNGNGNNNYSVVTGNDNNNCSVVNGNVNRATTRAATTGTNVLPSKLSKSWSSKFISGSHRN